MTTPPRLRLVPGAPSAPSPQTDREPGDEPASAAAGDGPDGIVDAEFTGAARTDASPFAGTGDDEAARAAARAVRMAALARQIVAGLVGFQFLASLRYLRWYVSLLRDGAVSPLALLAVPACIALYVATGLLAARRAPATCRTLFLAAAMALVVSVPFWGITDDWTWPLELGATLALAGAWYTRARVATVPGPSA